MSQKKSREQGVHRFSGNRVAYSILTITIVVAVVLTTATYYNVKRKARATLREAKNVCLCIRLLGAETYSLDRQIRDTGRANGFSKWAEEEIYRLAECDGEIYLVYLNPKNNSEIQIVYKNNGYMIELYSDGTNIDYTAYKDSWAVLTD